MPDGVDSPDSNAAADLESRACYEL